METLEEINLVNQQTVGWRVEVEESPHVFVGRHGPEQSLYPCDKFYRDYGRYSFLREKEINNQPDPTIGHADILHLSEIIAKDSHSFYWEKKEYDERVMYRLLHMESLVPEVREKKTVFFFLEKHLRPECREESLRLLDELCSDKEKVREYWKDVPDTAYNIKLR